jgi:hypothetical protein
MTREEFAKGWILLTVQPWGKRYAGTDGAATVQSELYYTRFGQTNPYVWRACCELYSSGDHLPSMDELRQTIANNTPRAKALPAPGNQICSMAEAFADAPHLRERLERMLGRALTERSE